MNAKVYGGSQKKICEKEDFSNVEIGKHPCNCRGKLENILVIAGEIKSYVQESMSMGRVVCCDWVAGIVRKFSYTF